jgi:predicted amidohydrolase YtcJ
LPEGAETIDGAGKFLIPGLWDMHVHIASPSYLPLFLANGVTGVREMHAFYPDSVFKMRKEIQEGKTLGSVEQWCSSV